jgi:rSAM/selenodomain-associated transferase 2
MNIPITIIIPVLHEAPIINKTLTHISCLNFPQKIEIIVSDGSLNSDTLKAIRDGGVKKCVSKKGRGAQMNAGARLACGDILLFLHADTRLPPDAFDLILNCCSKKGIVGGAFDLGINSRSELFRIIENTASIRSRITRIPYGDQAIFLSRKFFFEIGGYLDIPIMEDVELMRRIKKKGHQIEIISRKVLTSPRRWEKEGILYGMLRNWVLISLYFSGVSTARLIRYYQNK